MSNMYENELKHYGVMGMHWGIRRYQPYPAAYDGDGKYIGDKALKKKVKSANKNVGDMAKAATILGRGMIYSKIKAKKAINKLTKKLEKDPEIQKRSTKRAEIDAVAKTLTYDQMEAAYKQAEQYAKDMVASLKEQYGKENVRDLVYKTAKDGTQLLTEQVVTGKDIATAALTTIVGTAAGVSLPLMGAPIGFVYVYLPRSAEERGRDLSRSAKYAAKQQLYLAAKSDPTFSPTLAYATNTPRGQKALAGLMKDAEKDKNIKVAHF